MKKSLKLLFCATALASLAGCNKFDEADTAPDSGNGSLIKVYAKVAENDGTRANLHVGESAFTAEWEAGDALGILPVKTGGTAPATAAKFDYNATSAAFEGSLNDFAAGGSNYYAFFPHAKVTGTTANLPFGTCVRRRATISTAPTTRWSPPPGPTPLTTRRARPTAKTSPSRCTALRRSSISPSPRRPTR